MEKLLKRFLIKKGVKNADRMVKVVALKRNICKLAVLALSVTQ